MKLVHWIFSICLLTASCDVILNFNFGGSLRLAQLLMLLVYMAATARIIQDGRILWPRGGSALAIWVLWQICLIPLSENTGIALQFIALLLVSVAGILALVQVYGQAPFSEKLMRAYIASFAVIAGYGLLQFLLPLLFHVTVPFTGQWLVHGRVARINGFSYEPSYFATYIFLGWALLVDLRASGARMARGGRMKWLLLGLTAALIFSSSKTAWAGMVVEVASRIAPRAWRSLRGSLSGVREGRLVIALPSARVFRYGVLAAVLAAAAVIGIFVLFPDPTILLGGTGLAGTAAHSLNDRTNAITSTWTAFLESPWIGRGLGGVPVHLGAMGGDEVTTMEQARKHWGFPVMLDMLTASGILGFIPFMLFLYTQTFGAMRLARSRWSDERSRWVHALGRAMLMEQFLLLSDQNIFRVYLWFHFGITAALCYHLEFAAPTAAEKPVRSAPALLIASTESAAG